MVELIMLVVIIIKKVQYLLMSDKMRFGSISSPNQRTVRESIAFLETNALDDFNDVDKDEENEDSLAVYDDHEDDNDEQVNEDSLPIQDEAQEVSTLQSTDDAAGARMMSGSASVDDVKNCATAEEDVDDEEENEPTLPIHDDAQEVTTLPSTKEATGPRMMSGSASCNDLLPCANPNCACLMSRDYLCIGCG
jgi:hypothetical protein